jgi:hypothetical protein
MTPASWDRDTGRLALTVRGVRAPHTHPMPDVIRRDTSPEATGPARPSEIQHTWHGPTRRQDQGGRCHDPRAGLMATSPMT